MTTDAASPLQPGGGGRGPSEPPAPADQGVIAAAVALWRLPSDLTVALGYIVRELPALVQDVRSIVHSLAHLAEADSDALSDLLLRLSRAAADDGELTVLLAETARLTAARADLATERLADETGAGPSAGPTV